MRLAATLVLLSAGPVLAQTSFPMVTHCTPTAVQRGTSVAEKPGINTPAKAQPVPVPSVVCGRVEAVENVDYYKFSAKAEQVLTFEVTCARIQDKIHDLQKHADPILTLFDADGRELAVADVPGRPYGVALANTQLFITEPASGRVLVFSLGSP